MARLNCICGHSTRLTGDTPYEYYLLSNIKIDVLEEKIDNEDMKGIDVSNFIIDYAQETSRCPKCNRLYIYDSENGKLVMRIYKLEETVRNKENDNTVEQ